MVQEDSNLRVKKTALNSPFCDCGLITFYTESGSKCVVSLSKAHLLPKSTGNTQEAVAPSQHD